MAKNNGGNLSKQQELQLKNEMVNQFTKIRAGGLLQGAKAMCDVILKKAKNTEKTPEERLSDIIAFCEVSLSNKEIKL